MCFYQNAGSWGLAAEPCANPVIPFLPGFRFIQPHRLELPVFVTTDICPDFPFSPSIRVSSSVKLCADTELIMDGCFALDFFNEVLMDARKVQGEILCGCESQHLDWLGLTPVGLRHFTPTGDLSLSSFHWAGEGQSHRAHGTNKLEHCN